MIKNFSILLPSEIKELVYADILWLVVAVSLPYRLGISFCSALEVLMPFAFGPAVNNLHVLFWLYTWLSIMHFFI